MKIKSLDINTSDLFQREDDLIKSFSKDLLSENQNLTIQKERMNQTLLEVVAKMKSIDSSLENSAIGEQKNILKSIEKLEAKILKSVKNKNEVQLSQLRNLKNKLFPNGSLQERHENFAAIYLKEGKGFIDILLQKLEPFKFEFSVIKEES